MDIPIEKAVLSMDDNIAKVFLLMFENQNVYGWKEYPPISIFGFTKSQIVEVDLNDFDWLNDKRLADVSEGVIIRKDDDNGLAYTLIAQRYAQCLENYGIILTPRVVR